MRTLRLAFALPMVHSVLAAALWQWASSEPVPLGADSVRVPPAALIYAGLNTPVLLFGLLTYYIDQWKYFQRSFFGFPIGHVLFFIAANILWYIVGRLFDRTRGVSIPLLIEQKTAAFGIDAILLTAGGYLLFLVLFTNSPDGPVFSSLVVAWSIVLIISPARALLRFMRPAKKQSAPL